MRESTVEGYLRDEVKAAGGFAEKHVSPGYRGPPDRICSWPFGFKDWVETKRPGGTVEPHQKRDHARRRAMGHEVHICHTKEQVDEYVRFCKRRQASVPME